MLSINKDDGDKYLNCETVVIIAYTQSPLDDVNPVISSHQSVVEPQHV